MSRHFLNRKESRDIISRIESMGFEVKDIDTIEVDEQKDVKYFYSSRKAVAFQRDILIPSLIFMAEHRPNARFIQVDDGAVPHLLNGADLFAQGIVKLDPVLKAGDIAYISNVKGVYFAVGIMTRSAEDIISNRKGNAARTIHRANDDYYRVYSQQK